MDDAAIIDLYWARDEAAIVRTRQAHGSFLRGVARNILGDARDVDECENDTYLGAWGAMPDARPDHLRAFLGKICRNLALKRVRGRDAAKRGGGQVEATLSELEECLPSTLRAEDACDEAELVRVLNAFLSGLSADERRLFVLRYWHCEPVAGIARAFGFTEGKVKMSLKRTRDKMAAYLDGEGIAL